jgi:hypothetical protein
VKIIISCALLFWFSIAIALFIPCQVSSGFTCFNF